MQTNPTTNDQMKRGEFMRSLGLSSAALMAFYCMGTLTSCSGGGDDSVTPTPTPSAGLTGNTENSKGAISFTINLTAADYAKLKTQGEFIKVGDVLVANTKGNGYVTLQRLCTHQAQDAVAYRLASDNFLCSAHGSVFANSGAVITAVQPGQSAMKAYTTTLSTDGNTLTVTA